MISRRKLIAGLLSALGALFWLGPLAVGAGDDHHDAPRGPAFGHWDLPAPGHPGLARGVLLIPHHGPAFLLDTRLFPLPFDHPGSHGVMEGMLLRVPETGGPPEPFARVRGGWIAGPEGRGLFRARFFRPDPDPTKPDEVLGGIRGRFFDPHMAPGEPGRFEGHWALFP